MSKTIQKDIDTPSNSITGLGRPLKYPWNNMKEGDSFFVSSRDSNANPSSICSAGIMYFNRHEKDLKVIYRNVDNGFRFWAVSK